MEGNYSELRGRARDTEGRLAGGALSHTMLWHEMFLFFLGGDGSEISDIVAVSSIAIVLVVFFISVKILHTRRLSR